MSRYEYTDEERDINAVLANQDALLKSISMPDLQQVEASIANSEMLLGSLSYASPIDSDQLENVATAKQNIRHAMRAPSWEDVLEEALLNGAAGAELEDLFSEEELQENARAVRLLNEEYNQIHHLDELDVAIAVVAGLLSAAVDILLVGVPQKTRGGMTAAPLSNYIRDHIESIFTPEQLKRLEAAAKVPYDAPINKGFTETRVEGLCPGMHRLYSLGHDPLLGLVVGASDILTSRMTTIDKKGRIVSQVIERYADRTENFCSQSAYQADNAFLLGCVDACGTPCPLHGIVQPHAIRKHR